MKVSSVQSLIASKQVAFITIWQAHIVTNRVRNYIYAHIYKDDNVPRSHRTATLLRTSATLNLVWWLWSLAIAAWSRSIAVLRSHRKTDCSRSPCLCATRNHGRQSCQGPRVRTVTKICCNRPQRFDRQRLPIKGWSSRLLCQSDDGCVASWRNTHSMLPLSSAASMQMARGAQFMALAHIQMITVKYTV